MNLVAMVWTKRFIVDVQGRNVSKVPLGRVSRQLLLLRCSSPPSLVYKILVANPQITIVVPQTMIDGDGNLNEVLPLLSAELKQGAQTFRSAATQQLHLVMRREIHKQEGELWSHRLCNTPFLTSKHLVTTQNLLQPQLSLVDHRDKWMLLYTEIVARNMHAKFSH